MRLSKTVRVVNRKGLHARASARFVTAVHDLKADVEVEKDGATAQGRSIMSLMMLGAAKGDEITIHTSGDGAEDAMTVLTALVRDGFGEE